MHRSILARKWPSVSAAIAALLGFERSSGIPAPPCSTETCSGDTVDPLILKPPAVKILPTRLFAGHTSHSSHSSHSSGSSVGGHASHTSHASHVSGTSGGSYNPGTYVPLYPVPPTTPSVASTASPAPQSITTAPSSATPTTPSPISTPATVMRVELTNGAVIYGRVLVKSGAGITLQTLDLQRYKIPRLILTAYTISRLELPPEQ